MKERIVKRYEATKLAKIALPIALVLTSFASGLPGRSVDAQIPGQEPTHPPVTVRPNPTDTPTPGNLKGLNIQAHLPVVVCDINPKDLDTLCPVPRLTQGTPLEAEMPVPTGPANMRLPLKHATP